MFDVERGLPANATVHMKGKVGGDGPDGNSTFEYTFNLSMEPAPGWTDHYDVFGYEYFDERYDHDEPDPRMEDRDPRMEEGARSPIAIPLAVCLPSGELCAIQGVSLSRVSRG